MTHLRFSTLAISLFFCGHLFGFDIDVAHSPNSNLTLTIQAIEAAKKNILVNAYQFTSEVIADALVSKIEQGVQVQVLLEGEPIPYLTEEAKQIQERIVHTMEASGSPLHRYFVMTKKVNPHGVRRYKYDHAKYMVIDENTLLVGSENYSPTGHPEDGKKGTRGWETLIHDEWTAQGFKQIFLKDTSLAHNDIQQLVNPGRKSLLSSLPLEFTWDKIRPTKNIHWLRGEPLKMDAYYVEKLMSPDDSLAGILAFIDAAKKSLDLELMSFSLKWGHTGKISPLFNAVVNAAKRGVEVRVLLNDENAFIGGRESETSNDKTATALNEIAKREGLKMKAIVADVQAMGVKYIHNKGALADDDKVLVSSINWNQNSCMNNREAAVAITSKDIHSYYVGLFNTDWGTQE